MGSGVVVVGRAVCERQSVCEDTGKRTYVFCFLSSLFTVVVSSGVVVVGSGVVVVGSGV